MKNLDAKDWKILDLLSENSRNSNAKIAKLLKLHKNSVLYRIKRLTRFGIIDHFSFLPSYAALNKHTFYVFLRIKTEDLEFFYKYLRSHPFVICALGICGRWNFFLELVATNIEQFNDQLSEISTYLGTELLDYSTVMVHLPYKVENSIIFSDVPVKKTSFFINQVQSIDQIDRKILALISKNSQLSHLEISKKVGISADTSFYRLKKLVKNGSIIKFLPVVNLEKLGFQRYVVLLKFQNPSKGKFELLQKAIRDNPNIYLSFRTAGEIGVVIFCAFKSNFDLDKFLNLLSSSFSLNIYKQEVLLVSKVIHLDYFPSGLL